MHDGTWTDRIGLAVCDRLRRWMDGKQKCVLAVHFSMYLIASTYAIHCVMSEHHAKRLLLLQGRCFALLLRDCIPCLVGRVLLGSDGEIHKVNTRLGNHLQCFQFSQNCDSIVSSIQAWTVNQPFII